LNRFGWFLLLLFLAGALLLALMIGLGKETPTPERRPAAQSSGATEPEGLLIPVTGIGVDQLADTWGDSRAGGARVHNAVDIMAPRGTPVVAAAPGTVEKLFDSNDGGLTVYVRSLDGGTIHYYAHLDAYRPGLAEGQQVRAGEAIGTVGSTGNASPQAPHLHFEIKRMAAGEGWWQGREVNPYPLLAGKAAPR
jgi:peptidoglycan LD-endopeptidase LytH